MDYGFWSVLISAASFTLALYTHINHGRRLSKQEGELKDYELKREKRQEGERKQANVVATVVMTENLVMTSNRPKIQRSYKVEICNNGLSVARNINREASGIDDAHITLHEYGKFPYPKLNPGASFDIPMTLLAGAKGNCQIILTWDDDFGENRRREQTISF
jgi:hypothetical protein